MTWRGRLLAIATAWPRHLNEESVWLVTTTWLLLQLKPNNLGFLSDLKILTSGVGHSFQPPFPRLKTLASIHGCELVCLILEFVLWVL